MPIFSTNRNWNRSVSKCDFLFASYHPSVVWAENVSGRRPRSVLVPTNSSSIRQTMRSHSLIGYEELQIIVCELAISDRFTGYIVDDLRSPLPLVHGSSTRLALASVTPFEGRASLAWESSRRHHLCRCAIHCQNGFKSLSQLWSAKWRSCGRQKETKAYTDWKRMFDHEYDQISFELPIGIEEKMAKLKCILCDLPRGKCYSAQPKNSISFLHQQNHNVQ